LTFSLKNFFGQKMTIFKANFRLVNSSYCPKIIYLLENVKNLAFIDLVSLKYCAEKRLLKTHVAFFMKVTIDPRAGY
jgi:hypothetical protein